MDEFVEDVSEVNGQLMYRYGDELRPVEVSEVTLKFRRGDEVGERAFTTYHTHHGPVTHELDGKWVATRINWDPAKALAQSYTRTKLNHYAEFREMMNIRSTTRSRWTAATVQQTGRGCTRSMSS